MPLCVSLSAMNLKVSFSVWPRVGAGSRNYVSFLPLRS